MSTYSLSFVVLKKSFRLPHGQKKEKVRNAEKNITTALKTPARTVSRAVSNNGRSEASGRRDKREQKNLLSPKIPNIVLTTHPNLVKRILYTVSN